MREMEWINVPAAYVILAYVGAMWILAQVHPRRRSLPRRALAALAVGSVYCAVLFSFPNASGVPFFLCMAVVWLGMVCFIRYSARTGWVEAFYTTVRAFFLGDFTASLMWQLVYYLMSRGIMRGRQLVSLCVALPVLLLLLLAAWLVEGRLARNADGLVIRKKDLAAALVSGVLFYLLANISYVTTNSPFSSAILSETYLLRTLAEFGAVAILLAYHLSLIDAHARMRMQAVENAWRAHAEHYRAYEDSVALVNRKYHDLKHQLRLLRQDVAGGEKLAWLDEMERELSVYEAQNRTGNAALDVVLSANSLRCANEGIQLSCVADGAALERMHPLDISALFGNLLDNAIECEMRIPDARRRLISLSVARGRFYVQIRVRNICDEPVEFQNGLPVSTKQDADYHGFGTASISQIVEKYQGSLLMRCEDGWFETSILLP